MFSEPIALSLTAAAVGFIHTIAGPDHYLPFIAMSKARGWQLTRTMYIVFLCGLGHVLSSVFLGMLGIFAGVGVDKLEFFEGARGDLAAWLLFSFGLAYFIYGIYRAIKGHHHHHSIEEDTTGKKRNITPWILFTIFLFGPCEPLIPMLMYPAAKHHIGTAVAVAIVFSIVTIATMLSIVYVTLKGLNYGRFDKIHRYNHALAGFTISVCGALIIFVGL